MAEYQWSDDQLRAIQTDGSFIVSASAGSGKTTLMIERMLRLLETTDICSMLAVTFTNAQAEDMRGKIGDRLAEKMATENNPTLRQKYKEAFYRLSGAQISTLHAFCALVVRRYFYLANVNADFTLSSEGDIALRQAACLEAAIKNALLEGDAAFLLMHDALCRKRKHTALTDAVLSVSALQDAMLHPEEVWNNKDRDQRATLALDALASACKRDLLKRIADLTALCQRDGVASLAQWLQDYSAAVEVGFGQEIVAPRLTKPKNESSQLFDEYRQRVEKLREDVKNESKTFAQTKVLPETNQRFILPLKKLTEEYRRLYAQAKAKDNTLDFNDLERCCLTVLSDSHAREEIQKAYSVIFVDEYQDINPVQQAILSSIDTDQTFYVGDVKQSIYAFRLCDPTIFTERFFALSAQGRAEHLNQNYRSEQNILKFCDFVFKDLMTAEFGGMDYAEDSVFVPSKEASGEPVELLLIDKQSKESQTVDGGRIFSVVEDVAPKPDDGAYGEGRLIATQIRQLMADGLEGQPVRFGDIAVLVRSHIGADAIARALSDNGIPVSVSRDYDLFQNVQVCALLDFLRVLVNARQDYPLVAVMKQFYGFSDDELASLRVAHKSGPFYEAVFQADPSTDVGTHCREMLDSLKTLRIRSSVLRPSALLEEIADATDYYGRILDRADGTESYRAVKRFIEVTEQSVFDTDLVSYLDYLDANPKLMTETEPNATDAVTLSTMHKAKGLEYRIVFIARLGQNFSDRDERRAVFVSRRYGVCFLDYNEETRSSAKSRLNETIRLLGRFDNRQEEVRLLYVAMTRAKRKLFLVGETDCHARREPNGLTVSHTRNCMLEWVLSAVAARADVSFARNDGHPDCLYKLSLFAPSEDARAVCVPVLSPADPSLTEKINTRFAFFNQHNTLHPNVIAKTTATELNALYAPTFEHGGDRVTDGDATEAGRAYHRVMQVWNYRNSDVRAQLALLLSEGLMTEAQADLIKPEPILQATKVLAPFMDERALREVPFVAQFDSALIYGSAGSQVVLQGVADLIIPNQNGRFDLIDFKTTRGSVNYLSQAYRIQLWLYRDALTRSGYPIDKTWIYSFAHGCLIETDTTTCPLLKSQK